MITKVRKVDFSPDEYLAGTMGMTHAERGVYWQICTLIYSSGRPIHETDERLFRSTPDNPRTTRALLADLVRRGKIERSQDGELMVNRCRKELECASIRIRSAAENGSKGGRPRSSISTIQQDEKPEAFSAEKLSPSPSPSSSPSSSPITSNLSGGGAGVTDLLSQAQDIQGQKSAPSRRSKKPRAAEADGFAEFYVAFPLHVARDDAARAFGKIVESGRATQTELLAGANRYAAECVGKERRYISHPATWLNKGRWQDEAGKQICKETKNPWAT